MTLMEKLSAADVVVLCGGPGGEREVSLASGDNVHQALTRAGVANRKVEVPAAEPAKTLEALECGVAVMMFHGEFGEDGTAQRILERRGIAFTGSDSRVCALAMDKNACKELFVKNGVPTPRWVVTDHPDRAAVDVGEKGLKYPLFVKPANGGSSVGASRVDEPDRLVPAVDKTLGISNLALIEEMVAGRELTVGWLDGKILPIIELAAEGVFYDYEAKYLSDATRYICPADLPEETAALIRRHTGVVAEILGVRDLARVDLMLGADGPQFLELNALPGFTTHSLLPMAAKAAGVGLEDLCVSLAAMAAKRAGIV